MQSNGGPSSQLPPAAPAGEAPSSIWRLTPELLSARLGLIEDELETLRIQNAPPTPETARAVALLEVRFQECAHRVSLDFAQDPEQVGVPLLDEAVEWRKLGAEYAIPEAAAASDLAERIFGDGVEAWQDQNAKELPEGAVEPEFLLERLFQATSLATEWLDLGMTGEANRRSLQQERLRFRGLAEDLFRTAQPTPAVAEKYSLLLLDRADTLLATLDEFPPAEAADRLAEVADDVAWHLRRVEKSWLWSGRLQRKRRRLLAERQERLLDDRLDGLLGSEGRRRLERWSFLVLIVMLGCLVVPVFIPWIAADPEWALALDMIDSACCLLLLSEFFLKLHLVPHRGLWFRRHWLLGLLPSIPFGLISHLAATPAAGGEGLPWFVAWVLLLPRYLRFLQVARPLIPLLRFGFLLTRGVDQLARRMGGLLNRNIILYPTREERLGALRRTDQLAQSCRSLRAEIARRWRQILEAAAPEVRSKIYLERLEVIRSARMRGYSYRARIWRENEFQTREVAAEKLLRWLTQATPQDMEALLGEEMVKRTALVFRILAAAPVRWLPLVNWVSPRLPPRCSHAEATALGMRLAGALGLRYYHFQFFLADLYGTVTPSQLVDQVGNLLMKNSYKPVSRMFITGALFYAGSVALQLLPWKSHAVESYLESAGKTLGVALFVLGGLGLFTLGLGFWLRRLAQEASEFYERAALAQFLSLTETIRCRSLARDAAVVYNRVLRPESRLQPGGSPERERAEFAQLVERVEKSLLGVFVAGDVAIPFSSMERAVMLFRDSLDGAMLTDDDARTTFQLLGNPSLQQFLSRSERPDPPSQRDLDQLDVVRMKAPLWGPFLWYNFVSRAVSQSVARLIIDYNRHAVPLAQLPLATPLERERFEQWLHQRGPELRKVRRKSKAELNDFATTFFTAMHFLDFDRARDEEVRLRFGAEVYERLLRDRSLTIRQIFGSYPLHRLPKELRVFNPNRFYENYLAGGQALFLPWFFMVYLGRKTWQGGAFLWRSVQEIRTPHLRVEQTDAADADFHAAVRKIGRMRHPLVKAATNLRIKFDPEYLGVHVPEAPRDALAGHGLDADLAILDPDPAWMERIQGEKARAAADMVRLEKLVQDGLLARIAEHLNLDDLAEPRGELLRAAAVAYLADLNGVRRMLSAEEILLEVFERAAGLPALPSSPLPRIAAGIRFRKFLAEHGGPWTKRGRRVAWRAVCHNVWGAGDCLAAWARFGRLARAEGEARLALLLRHPARVSEQLVTLRSVQTLALLDVLNYREHVYRLGQYAMQGDPPDQLFDWGRSQARLLSIAEGEGVGSAVAAAQADADAAVSRPRK